MGERIRGFDELRSSQSVSAFGSGHQMRTWAWAFAGKSVEVSMLEAEVLAAEYGLRIGSGDAVIRGNVMKPSKVYIHPGSWNA